MIGNSGATALLLSRIHLASASGGYRDGPKEQIQSMEDNNHSDNYRELAQLKAGRYPSLNSQPLPISIPAWTFQHNNLDSTTKQACSL